MQAFGHFFDEYFWANHLAPRNGHHNKAIILLMGLPLFSSKPYWVLKIMHRYMSYWATEPQRNVLGV